MTEASANAIDPNRLRLRDIAQETIKVIKDGYFDFADSNTMRFTRHNIGQLTDNTVRGTEYFALGTSS